MIVIDRELSNKLANLSFVCTLLVTFIHCQSVGSGRMFYLLRVYIPGAFLNMAVPIFFSISGFLLAGKCGVKNWYGDVLRKRVKTLLVPYVILNVLYFPIVWFIHIIAVNHYGADDSAAVMTLSWETPLHVLGVPFFYGPAITPLWYIATLLYFVILSPLFYWALKKSKVAAIATVLGSVALLGIWHSVRAAFVMPRPVGHFLYYGFSLWGLIFFVFGMAARVWLRRLPTGWLAICGGIIGSGSALFLAQYGLCHDNVLYVLPTILCMICALWLMPSTRWSALLTGNAFALYVLHVPFLYLFDALLKLLHVYTYTETWWGLLCQFILCVVSVIFVTQFARTRFPKVVKFCLGGR